MLKQIAPLSTASALALALALPAWAQETTDEGSPPVESQTVPADQATPEEIALPEGETTNEQATDAPAEGEAAEGQAAAPAEGETAAPAQDVSRDTVVASVNGSDITLGQVLVAARQLPAQYQQLPPDILFGGVVDQLVQQELLAQTVTEEPALVGIVLENQRRQILANSALEEVAAGAVTEDAVQAAYDAAFGSFEGGTEWNASHILVATEEEAQAVVERLNAGEDFATVAQEVSTDPGSGPAGGELGWFGPGMMVPQFEEGVSGLQPGEVSAPIESEFGFHVIRLNETRPQEAPPLDQVRAEIEGQVQQDAIEAYIADLEGQGQVTRPEPGQFDPAILNDASLLED
jgi:peptidyl-prolyl cis-trans isomerase C